MKTTAEERQQAREYTKIALRPTLAFTRDLLDDFATLEAQLAATVGDFCVERGKWQEEVARVTKERDELKAVFVRCTCPDETCQKHPEGPCHCADCVATRTRRGLTI